MISIFVSMIQGCSHSVDETISLGEWIHLICMKGELESNSDSPPYYLNVTPESLYFTDIQTAVEWEILDEEIAIDPQNALTREWAAYTLIRLSGKQPSQTSQQIKDINQSQFPNYVQASIANGLFDLDEHKRFYPKKNMSQMDAERLLDQVYEYLNTMTFEDEVINEIEWNEDFDLIEEEPISFDSLSNQISYPTDTQIKTGDICKVVDENGEETYLQVEEVEQNNDEVVVTGSYPVIEDTIQSLDIANTFDIDFTQAEIIEDTSQLFIQEAFSEEDPISLMSTKPLQRTYSFQEWKITYNVTSSGIKAEVYKTLPSGLYVYGKASLSNVKPTYKWKMEGGKIEEGYLRIDFRTNESIGARISDYRTLYGDFSEIKADNFLNSLKNVLKTRSEMGEVTIPLATIKVPVPNAPLVDLKMQLQLKLYVDGRCELSLTQNHTMGMEIRNGNMRVIQDHQNQSETVLKASTGVTCGLNIGMEVAKMTLADITCEAGAKANLKTTLHLYDALGNHTVQTSDSIPTDLASDLSQGNGNVLVCGDINAYWILRIKLNQSGTLANRLGFSKTFDVLNEKNGKLIPGSKTHIENWHFVSHCTRRDRIKSVEINSVKTDQIKLQKYAMILYQEENQEIGITSLPDGITKESLRYTSSNPNVASVENGIVTGLQEGSTIITISSSDGKYSAKMNILVKEKK